MGDDEVGESAGGDVARLAAELLLEAVYHAVYAAAVPNTAPDFMQSFVFVPMHCFGRFERDAGEQGRRAGQRVEGDGRAGEDRPAEQALRASMTQTLVAVPRSQMMSGGSRSASAPTAERRGPHRAARGRLCLC